MNEKKVQMMVSRFLRWNLPKDFMPDGGISFKNVPDARGYAPTWPVGTNLLTAEQAKEMITYIMADCSPEWICPSCKETGDYSDLPENRSIDICRGCGSELMNYEKYQMTSPCNLPEVPGDNKKG